jgi:two-component system, chemotaxis family, sensor kinase CheA
MRGASSNSSGFQNEGPTEFVHTSSGEYFTECEEHLDWIHRHLIMMEGFTNRNLIDLNIVDELLRAFHSVKGLSAIASVHAAKQAAHAMEEVIRDLKQAGTGPTDIAMEMLVRAL